MTLSPFSTRTSSRPSIAALSSLTRPKPSRSASVAARGAQSMMDVGIDPRLQQSFYNNADYPFPGNAVTGTYNDSLPQYGFGQQPQLNAGQGGPRVESPLRNRSNNVRDNQSRPRQADLRTRQDHARGNGGAAQSPVQQNVPQRQNTSTPKQASGLVFKNSSSTFPSGGTSINTDAELSSYVPLTTLQQSNINQPNNYFSNSPPIERPPVPNPPPVSSEGTLGANPFDPNLALVPYPAGLPEWRERLFNISQPLHLSESEFLTYFPHVDNVYSHRSTQKYKRKPFVSHYWDCRLKGRPSGTKKSDDPNKKKRKREKRERDLCDVKIKITEWFSCEECEAQNLPNPSDDGGGPDADGERDSLQIVMDNNVPDPENAFGMLEPARRFPIGHPGADGKRWYTIQRVNNAADGVDLEAEPGSHPLDHKHSLDESDRIKKNSVQRWQLQQEKEKRQSLKGTQVRKGGDATLNSSSQRNYASLPYFASGAAARTSTLHRSPVSSHLTFYANAYCPFAQRVWIALEIKEIPYQYVEIIPTHVLNSASGSSDMNEAIGSRPKELLDVNPEGVTPCIKHGNWGIWESGIMMEYLEDLDGFLPLLPLGNAQLRAHCRLWVDHLNRKVLPAFYALLLTPPPDSPGSAGNATTPEGLPTEISDETHGILISTLQKQITALVNASHAIGPFFLGEKISYVDVAFAPWIIRLSRVMSFYRNFPRPEVGTRWQRWVDAVESDDRVRRTISDDNSYHSVYKGVGEDGWDGRSNDAGWHAGSAERNGVAPGGMASVRARLQGAQSGEHGAEGQELGRMSKKVLVEAAYAKKVLREEGFGLGGDLYGQLGLDPEPGDGQARI